MAVDTVMMLRTTRIVTLMKSGIYKQSVSYYLSKVPKGPQTVSKIPALIKKHSSAPQNDERQNGTLVKCASTNTTDEKKPRLSISNPGETSPPQYIPRSSFPRIPLHRLMPTSTKSSLTSLDSRTSKDPHTLHDSPISTNHSMIKFEMTDSQPKLESKPREHSQISNVMSDLFGETQDGIKLSGENGGESPEMILDDMVFKVTLERGTPEPHPLRKSILGLISMNKALDKVGDDTLWKLIPRGKVYGVPPFETKCDPRINSFLNWEQEMLRKRKDSLFEAIERNRDFVAFKKTLALERSIYVKIGLRRKLNWDLVKMYKAFKAKWDAPKDDGKVMEDEDDQY